MVVCVSPHDGWFYRINSRSHHRPCIALARSPDHLFLKHDSYLEVGEPLELDDYVVGEALGKSGIIGRVDPGHCAAILGHLAEARYLNEADKAKIRTILGDL